jgi:hypothetical protein
VSRKEIERGLNLKPGIREKPILTITQGGGEMQNSCRSEIEMQERNRKDMRRESTLFCGGSRQSHFDIWTHTVNVMWQYSRQTTSQIQFYVLVSLHSNLWKQTHNYTYQALEPFGFPRWSYVRVQNRYLVLRYFNLIRFCIHQRFLELKFLFIWTLKCDGRIMLRFSTMTKKQHLKILQFSVLLFME